MERVVPLTAPERIALIKRKNWKAPKQNLPPQQQTSPAERKELGWFSWSPVPSCPALFFFLPAARTPHPLGFSETKRQGMEKMDLRPLGGGDVQMCDNWEQLWCDPTPLLKLWVGVWTHAGCGFCPQAAALQPALETRLVLGCFYDPVTPISWKGQGWVVATPFFTQPYSTRTSGPFTISRSPTPRTRLLKSHTQKLKTSPGLCADGSSGALVGTACEKQAASRWRPVCPDTPG